MPGFGICDACVRTKAKLKMPVMDWRIGGLKCYMSFEVGGLYELEV